MSRPTPRRALVRNAVRRFSHLPDRTIARHLLVQHGELFNQDMERARSAVRAVRGHNGAQTRRKTEGSQFVPVGGTIQLPETWSKVRTPFHLPVGLWGVLSDIHVPCHEPKPIEAAVQWLQANKVDGVFINGDLQDCASVSFWPQMKRDFNREVDLVVDFLDFLRSEFPTQKIVYKPGNHEYRLPRRYAEKLPEMAESPLAAMETLIGFEDRKIEFLDYFQLVYAGKLPIIHGHEVASLRRTVNPAHGLFLRAKSFAACSHCHTTSEHTARDINGTVITTWSFGCLCDLAPDYNPIGNDWNWGAGIIQVNKGGGFEVENRRIMPSGKLK